MPCSKGYPAGPSDTDAWCPASNFDSKGNVARKPWKAPNLSVKTMVTSVPNHSFLSKFPSIDSYNWYGHVNNSAHDEHENHLPMPFFTAGFSSQQACPLIGTRDSDGNPWFSRKVEGFAPQEIKLAFNALKIDKFRVAWILLPWKACYSCSR